MNHKQGTWQCSPAWSSVSSAECAKHFSLPAKKRSKSRLIAGRNEWVAFPELGISPILAKADTGARTSTLHAEDIHFDETTGLVSFVTIQHDGTRKPCSCKALRVRHVRSSSGHGHPRIVIRTSVMFPGGLTYSTEFTLADRSTMKRAVLLGRRAMVGYFVIDPLAEHLLGTINDFSQL